MRHLDRSRPYGEVIPQGRAVYVQDDILYDAAGNEVRPEDHKPPPFDPSDIDPDDDTMDREQPSDRDEMAFTEADWRKMHWRTFRRELKRRGFETRNKAAGIAWLKAQGVI